MFLFCISNLFLIGQKIQELNTMQSNSDEEIYLNIRKVSCGILNITISLVYLKYPTFIEPFGHRSETWCFPRLHIKWIVIFIEEVLVYPLAFHTTGKSWQENKNMWLRYMSHPVKYIQGVCYCKDFGQNYQPGITKIEILAPR